MRIVSLKYKEKYNYDTLEVVYIKYDPKTEKGEKSSTEFANKRDKLYRLYINNFAKKYNSTVEYLSVGGITAKFNPKLSL